MRGTIKVVQRVICSVYLKGGASSLIPGFEDRTITMSWKVIVPLGMVALKGGINHN